MVINEVAVYNNNISVCNGTDWIELYNEGSGPALLANYTVLVNDQEYDLSMQEGEEEMELAAKEFLVVCSDDGYFDFLIEPYDIVSLADETGSIVSTTTVGNVTEGLSWSRRTNGTEGAFFEASLQFTPAATNVFPVHPTQVPWQSCGVQRKEYGYLCEYQFDSFVVFPMSPNPEFSAAAFDGRYCSLLLTGDEGFVFDFSIPLDGVSSSELERTVQIIGGSSDTEGSCFYYDETTQEQKYVYVDERERTVSLCDFPTRDEQDGGFLYRDSNCTTIGLTEEQALLQSSRSENEGFEGVACDPANQRLFVVQERRPMKIWLVDLVTESFSEFLDVEGNSAWTDLVTDLTGIAYDPIREALYVLSQESRVVVHSNLDGEIIGVPLDLRSYSSSVEGITFYPESGDLWIASEPNRFFRFVRTRDGSDQFCNTVAPTTAPVPTTASPTLPLPTPDMVINEVAVYNNNISVCNGTDWIELYNEGSGPALLANYTILVNDEEYDFSMQEGEEEMELAAKEFLVVCSDDGYFDFLIEPYDIVSLADETGSIVSTTTVGNVTEGLSWSRRTNGTEGAFFEASLQFTPAATNVFPVHPTQVPWQSCGVQRKEYGYLCEYQFDSFVVFPMSPNPEFSAAAFDGRYCSLLLTGDEGFVFDFSIPLDGVSSSELERTVQIIGGSSDTEGSCFYYDETTQEQKYVYVDERERTVSLCDFPTRDEQDGGFLYRDSNCTTIGLTEEQALLQSSRSENEGFEGVACDPANQRLFVVQERRPMKIWLVDLVTESFSEFLDVEGNSAWTDLVTDLTGIAYDPIREALYVLSQESRVVVHSNLDGEIIGVPLDLRSYSSSVEGITFYPESGDLWIASEPNRFFRFVRTMDGSDQFCNTVAPASAPKIPVPAS
eukprot:CAMPEP_0118716016 /NCGR_PEP_ID=MMETSP0800-20121206/27254_1 /TAXON_ID=210618 ORGANISM="Striatella unipunctata, Strain CCMP2910" /NCGR_SAMPLE_ID=MMETSP0800 /ASSEMBLY_ACC=CAM_ASM_000638 /LENGTH=892 /DNA_ID=CAMNT_0006622365 /DNA_START=133 /DNA_END=2811 /DNA_ORIENTATION=-